MQGQTSLLTYTDASWGTLNNTFYTLLAHLYGKTVNGHPLDFARVTLYNNVLKFQQRVLMRTSMAPYATDSIQEVVLEPREKRTVALNPNFDYDKLYNLRGSTTIEARVILDNGSTRVLSQKILLEPLTRVRWYLTYPDGDVVDMRPTIATLITPEDKGGEVMKLLRQAAGYTRRRVMDGYTSGDKADVTSQLAAIFIALQKRGYIYQSIASDYFDQTQRVRMPAESLIQNQGNCMDTCLVFAAALEAAGLEPVLCFIKGHVFIGVMNARRSNSLILVETTMVAHSSFDQARQKAEETFDAAMKRDPHFRTVDVIAQRRAGFYPIVV